MNLSDTFYIALCMTVLILGVVYWFWTQNQYIQRKLNLLENIVYEMKTALQIPGSSSSEAHESDATALSSSDEQVAPVEYPPAPSSVIDEEDEDLLHEELHGEASFPSLETMGDRIQLLPSLPSLPSLPFMPSAQDQMQSPQQSPKQAQQSPKQAQQAQELSIDAELVPDDLQPGGVGSGISIPQPSDAKASALDGMTLKELKRLAEQRGVSGTSAMRKQQLIDALRVLPASGAPLASIAPLEGVVDLS